MSTTPCGEQMNILVVLAYNLTKGMLMWLTSIVILIICMVYQILVWDMATALKQYHASVSCYSDILLNKRRAIDIKVTAWSFKPEIRRCAKKLSFERMSQ